MSKERVRFIACSNASKTQNGIVSVRQISMGLQKKPGLLNKFLRISFIWILFRQKKNAAAEFRGQDAFNSFQDIQKSNV